MDHMRPYRNAQPTLRCTVSVIAVTLALSAAGCVPTISRHSYRDVAVSIADADSGAPVAQTGFRVAYGYSPIDSPLVAHVELRTPDEVRAKTDAHGKAVVRLADYAWDITLYVDDIGEEGYSGFVLTDDVIRAGGTVASYTRPRLRLELSPLGNQGG
jgi:hypothetical protein